MVPGLRVLLARLRASPAGLRAPPAGLRVPPAGLGVLLAGLRVPPAGVSLPRAREMSVFTQRVNPVTGAAEWEMQPESYDYQQEVARSAYADMLHDTERNQKYEQGLRAAVAALRSAGRPVHVLDIGTGTGLLSMMACRLGADTVTACEAFRPMAECAGRILAANGVSERVRLVPKRSTELTVGEAGDLPRRCNLLVTEVFDTELIGEGALATFKHAHQHLLEPESLVVPSSAVVYAQVIESAAVRRWSRFSPVGDLHVPDDVAECHGAAAVHDLQLSQLSRTDFTPLSQPVPVFGFDWTGRRTPIVFDRTSVARVEAINSGTSHAVFMWWDITMDPAGEVLLSCAPYWAHPDTQGLADASDAALPWRDHWMQAVYYLPREVRLRRREEFNLVSSHDEYSLWFRVDDRDDVPVPGEVSDPAPICLCGLHVTVSRSRAGAMNDPRRHQAYIAALKAAITPGCTVLVISEACLYGLVAARLGARRVYVLESSRITRRALDMYCRDNDVDDIVQFVEPEQAEAAVDGPVDVVFSEPFFYGSVLPWHDLHFWYRKQQLAKLCSEKTKIIPHSAELKCVGVEYKDLWKIRAPLKSVEGFKLDLFDELIESACREVDSVCEPHPLWEYPCRALTAPVTVDTFPLAAGQPADTQRTVHMDFTAAGSCNGAALWVDWLLDEAGELRVSTGPVDPVKPGARVSWDRYARQAVHLLRAPRAVTPRERLSCRYGFTAGSGHVQLKFQLDS